MPQTKWRPINTPLSSCMESSRVHSFIQPVLCFCANLPTPHPDRGLKWTVGVEGAKMSSYMLPRPSPSLKRWHPNACWVIYIQHGALTHSRFRQHATTLPPVCTRSIQRSSDLCIFHVNTSSLCVCGCAACYPYLSPLFLPLQAPFCCAVLQPLKWLPALLVCLRKPLVGRNRAGLWSLVVCGWWRQGWRENREEPVDKRLMWWSRREDGALMNEEDERKTCLVGKLCFLRHLVKGKTSTGFSKKSLLS